MYSVFELLIQASMPVIVAIFGAKISRQIAEKGRADKYIELAIRILDKPKGNYPTDTQLRQWALKVFSKYSPVPLVQEVKEALETVAFVTRDLEGEPIAVVETIEENGYNSTIYFDPQSKGRGSPGVARLASLLATADGAVIEVNRRQQPGPGWEIKTSPPATSGDIAADGRQNNLLAAFLLSHWGDWGSEVTSIVHGPSGYEIHGRAPEDTPNVCPYSDVDDYRAYIKPGNKIVDY